MSLHLVVNHSLNFQLTVIDIFIAPLVFFRSSCVLYSRIYYFFTRSGRPLRFSQLIQSQYRPLSTQSLPTIIETRSLFCIALFRVDNNKLRLSTTSRGNCSRIFSTDQHNSSIFAYPVFVYSFTSNRKTFHLYGDITITNEGCKTSGLLPLSRKGLDHATPAER